MVKRETYGFFYRNGLSICTLVLFLLCWLGQALTGWHVYNQERVFYHRSPVDLSSYLGDGHFGEATGENWESEFLQLMAYVILTIFLRQKGSAESKSLETDAKSEAESKVKNKDLPWPVRRKGWILRLYEYSLTLAFLLLFLASFAWHLYGGYEWENEERVMQGQDPQTFAAFASSAQFWFQSMQNWQSEFLAVLSIVLLSIWLRQKGSPESKPVNAPHSQTGK